MFFNKFVSLFVALCAMFAMVSAVGFNHTNTTDNVGPIPMTIAERNAARLVKSQIASKNVQKALEQAEKQGAASSPAGTIDNTPVRNRKTGKK